MSNSGDIIYSNNQGYNPNSEIDLSRHDFKEAGAEAVSEVIFSARPTSVASTARFLLF